MSDTPPSFLDRREMLAAGLAGMALTSLPARALAQSGARAPDAPRTGSASVAAHRVEVPMPHGGVTAGHPLAAMAGTRMLMQGGTAADAVVAAMAVMNVVEPWASSAGGNGFATCLDRKTGKVQSLAFTGGAPRLLDPDGDPKALDHGPKALTVPGAFGGWIALARRFGKLPLSTLLEPAIGYARDGHPLDASIAMFITRAQKTLALYPTSAAIFLPGGQPPAPRSIFRNPDLARSFQALADAESQALKGGADRDRALQAAHDYFYTGPIAQEFARFSTQTGGWLRLDDLKAYQPRWDDPVTTNYRGLDVYCSPLTSRTGLELCEQLNLVEGLDLAALPTDAALAQVAEGAQAHAGGQAIEQMAGAEQRQPRHLAGDGQGQLDPRRAAAENRQGLRLGLPLLPAGEKFGEGFDRQHLHGVALLGRGGDLGPDI